MNALRWLIAVTLLAPQAALAATAQGVVFEDRNRDGQRAADEPGIARVRVSNGEDVVATDREGRYRISVADEAVLFITKPSGYAPPLNQDELPRFFYLHQPKGSPAGLRFTGVAPTGPLPASIDFPLVRQAESPRFSAILFSDTQPESEAEVDWIRDTAVQELVGSTAAFGMTLGDIMFDDLSLYPRLNRVIGQIGVPWYNVPGNHEIDYSAASDAYLVESFARHRAEIKSWVEAQPSTHLFVADLPDELGPGTYVVHVRARNEYGATHASQRILEVSGTSAPAQPGLHYRAP